MSKNKEANHNHNKPNSLKNLWPKVSGIRGSSAVLLSLVVSGSVFATVVMSQKTLMQFLSAKQQTSVQWERNLVAKYGLTLGGFLVSGNLVLCREKGWTASSTDPLCKWTHDTNDLESKTPGDYKLTQISDSSSDNAKRKRLVFEGQYKIEDRKHQYQISFDLVDWRQSRIQNLVGQIPKYFCRQADTYQLVKGKCPDICTPSQDPKTDNCKKRSPQTIKCKNAQGGDISNTMCEYIRDQDQDYYIVVITVRTPLTKNTAQVVRHAGVRRPMASVTVSVENQPVCTLYCETSDTASNFPACRNNPANEGHKGLQKGLTTMKMKVTKSRARQYLCPIFI